MIDNNRYVYRYRDWNRPGDGASSLFVERRVVVKETDQYVYHISLPWNWAENPVITPEMLVFCMRTKGYHRAKKTKKDAHVSAWRLDQKVAMADWLRRKGYQLSRLQLAIERVNDLINTGIKDGIFLPQTGMMTPIERVISAPDFVDGTVTPEADQYCWQEY